jgi:hypothetical protein
MNAYEKIKQLNEKDYKQITGVTWEVFEKMHEVLRKKHIEEHAKGGQPGMAVEMRLTLSLEYWREYRSFRHMANDHQISKTEINRAVLWVEDALSESEEFKIKELKERFRPGEETVISVIVVDVEEQPIERPVTKQEASYSGKKRDTRQNTKSL